jgi:peptidoglycan/LPS O-acetylase OafA/YrhL
MMTSSQKVIWAETPSPEEQRGAARKPENSTAKHVSGRIPELDGLRALAMMSVFLYGALNAPLLWMGVDVFFVLSGFLITGILLEHKKTGSSSYFGYFYGRRARRILPPYWLLMIVSSMLFGTAWVKHWYWYVFFSTNVPVALHQVSHSSLDVLWSLAVEEQFYLIWPVIILLIPEVFLAPTAWGLLLLAPILRFIATPYVNNFAPIYHLTPFRMDLLCAGALIAITWRKESERVRRYSSLGRSTVFASLGVLLLFSRFNRFRTSENTFLTNTLIYFLTLLVAVGALTWTLKGRGVWSSFLKLPALRYLGRISYSMYLIHAAAIMLVQSWFHNRLLVLLLSFTASIVYSTLSWHFLEKPMLGSPRSKVPERLMLPHPHSA